MKIIITVIISIIATSILYLSNSLAFVIQYNPQSYLLKCYVSAVTLR